MKLTQMMNNSKMDKAFDFIPNPNYIFVTAVPTDKTEGGVLIPESSRDPNKTPEVIVQLIGENIQEQLAKAGMDIGKGTRLYVQPNGIEFMPINGITAGLIKYPDVIIGMPHESISV